MSFTVANRPEGNLLSYRLWTKCERALPKTPRSADAKEVLATLIETEEAAKRLARVILSDVQLYNKDLIASGGDLTAALHEGRHHFKSRVAVSMHGVFDIVAIERKLLATTAGYEAAPPAEKTPAVVTSDHRPTPVSMDASTEASLDAAPTVVSGTMALPPGPDDYDDMPDQAPVTLAPTPVPARAPIRTPAPPPVVSRPIEQPKPTPAPAPVAVAKPVAAQAPRKPAPAPAAEPPIERTPPPIPERARVAPVQITITATPPPPAPYEMPWTPPAAQAPVFVAPPEPVVQKSAPFQTEAEPAPVADLAVPNLKPPFPWIRIVLLIAVVVGIVAGVVHLTR
jgi:hypothetical protein